MANKKSGRPGMNPTKKEIQLRTHLSKLVQLTGELEIAKKHLEAEASDVLETLWNSHIDIHQRLQVIEDRLGIETKELVDETGGNPGEDSGEPGEVSPDEGEAGSEESAASEGVG